MPVKTRIIAIINVTPDSFSDGGEYFSPDSAIAAIKQALNDGADAIDIGAESTRPGATPISHAEEWRRLFPVLAQLKKYPLGGIISVDTRHPETAKKALALGAHWINDVSGFEGASMVDAVKDTNCKLVMMHSLGVPVDKHVVLLEDIDVVQYIINWAAKRFSDLETSGIARSRFIFDPGIGFGKTPAQSREILQRVNEFSVLGVPLFIGHSRKSFLMLEASNNAEKDVATLEISRELVSEGVAYLRVHNVALHKNMLKDVCYDK
ncbi:MAG: dihydropteroate synthase [Alphaproteobacteria bacterium]|jgi:dihydropteroate synthase